MSPKKDEAFERYKQLAEASIRESLAHDNDYLGHMLLAELLKEDPERLDEAEDHLNQAKALTTNEDMLLTIEDSLGEIAMEQAQYHKALRHFQGVEKFGTSLPQQTLRDLFGLTPAEAKVAMAFFEGLTSKEAAENLGLSFHTVRVQLARIFEKTQTHRQAELVRLMMGAVGVEME
jgi:DNA-binding CsgD family transcriptional regulator